MNPRRGPPRRKNRIAPTRKRQPNNLFCCAPAPRASVILTICSLVAQHPPMLARVLSAAVNGIGAFPAGVEVNCGWGDTIIVIVEAIPPNTPFCSKWHQSQQVRMQKAFASRNSTSRVPVLVFAYSAR